MSKLNQKPDPASKKNAEYPEGLTGESAYYELDGPNEQVVRGLNSIIKKCKKHIENAPQSTDISNCQKLLDEAEAYLEEFAL